MESAVCPITLELMRDPVMAADGHTYEREALLRWLKTSGGGRYMTWKSTESESVRHLLTLDRMYKTLFDAR